MIYVLMTLIYKVENGNYCVLLMCVWKEKFLGFYDLFIASSMHVLVW